MAWEMETKLLNSEDGQMSLHDGIQREPKRVHVGKRRVRCTKPLSKNHSINKWPFIVCGNLLNQTAWVISSVNVTNFLYKFK